MCQECIQIEEQIKKENEEAINEEIENTLDRIVNEMATNPNWQDVARREIERGINGR